MRIRQTFPAAIWRRRRQIAAGEFPISLDGPGAAKCSLRRALLAPGYHLPLLRSYQAVSGDGGPRVMGVSAF